MDDKKALEVIEDLRTGTIESHLVTKEYFMLFRNVLITQKDRPQFKGIAQKGGNVLYTYEKNE